MYVDFDSLLRRFLGGDGTEPMKLYRVSGNLYTVSFDSNLGDVMVRRTLRSSLVARCLLPW